MNETTTGLVIKKDVKTEISETRKDELAREVVAHTLRIRELEEQKKLATRDITAKVKAERADMDRKADAIRTGVLEEQVDVTEQHDFSRNEVSYHRLGSGEKVAVRAMTQGERQLKIDGVDDDAPPVVSVDKGKAKKRLRSVPDEAESLLPGDAEKH
jgi:hypothetical protein